MWKRAKDKKMLGFVIFIVIGKIILINKVLKPGSARLVQLVQLGLGPLSGRVINFNCSLQTLKRRMTIGEHTMVRMLGLLERKGR